MSYRELKVQGITSKVSITLGKCIHTTRVMFLFEIHRMLGPCWHNPAMNSK